MDYFPIKVTKLPDINGQPATAAQFLEYLRRNINSFVNTELSEFTPYNAVYTGTNEAAIWTSQNPVGAIIHIEIPFDEGSVICSDYNPNYWRFTTISAPYDWSHPVSGTREFGFEQNADGSYTFYTRGTDRITGQIQNLLFEAETFDGADNLWKSFQEGVKNFVNQSGGIAAKGNPIVARPNWETVNAVLNGYEPVSSLGCK
jgi:hypothetical protein